jgi:hypothetical protein
MLNKYNKWWVGLMAGFISPVIAFLVYYSLNYSHMGMYKFFRYLINGNIYTQLMSLCVIANLPMFFIFIQFHMYNSARGVVLMTIVYTVANFILKIV